MLHPALRIQSKDRPFIRTLRPSLDAIHGLHGQSEDCCTKLGSYRFVQANFRIVSIQTLCITYVYTCCRHQNQRGVDQSVSCYLSLECTNQFAVSVFCFTLYSFNPLSLMRAIYESVKVFFSKVKFACLLWQSYMYMLCARFGLGQSTDWPYTHPCTISRVACVH